MKKNSSLYNMIERDILNEQPLFSVLIANYNNGRYIQEAINSVFAQEYQNWEIILVDDGSTDNSLDILKPYLEDERIRLFLNNKNYGCSYTKKRCIEEASGELCGYLDPDDALAISALNDMVENFRNFPDSGILYSKYYRCDENLNVVEVNPRAKPVPNNGPYILYNTGISHFAVFRRDFYLQTEGLSNKYTKAIDQNLYLLLDQTGPVRFFDKALYFYRIHRGGISTFDNIIPAAYQYYNMVVEFSEKGMLRTTDAQSIKRLMTIKYKYKYKIAKLEKDWVKILTKLVAYYFNGGNSEVHGIVKRSITNPLNLLKSINRISGTKSK